MKLYLFDTINRYKRYSETLDVKTKICNRPWIVFNDGGEKEVYKFKEDGTINIVLSGRVTRGTWEYDPSDKTIIISASNQSYMVHPGMYDDMLLALQVDGTDQCSFLIEENNSQKFAPKTYSDLMLFFKEKERKVLEEEERIRLLKEEEERARKKTEEEAKRKREERRKWEEEHKEEIEARKRKEEQEKKIKSDFEIYFMNYNNIGVVFLGLFALVAFFLFIWLISTIGDEVNNKVYSFRLLYYLDIIGYIFMSVIISSILFLIFYIITFYMMYHIAIKIFISRNKDKYLDVNIKEVIKKSN